MTAPDLDQITITEYARRRGCSDVAVHNAIKRGKIVKGVIRVDGKPKIIPYIADAEWSASAKNPPRVPGILAHLENNPPPPEPPAPVIEPYVTSQAPAPAERTDSSTVEAKRQKAVLEVAQAKLAYQKELGKLVDKDKVYKSLYMYGQELRAALQVIPDRCIDGILAARSRNEAHGILSDAIIEALENITDIEKRSIT